MTYHAGFTEEQKAQICREGIKALITLAMIELTTTLLGLMFSPMFHITWYKGMFYGFIAPLILLVIAAI